MSSRHTIVVIRQLAPGCGSRWMAWLGVGGHMVQVSPPDRRRKRGNRGGRGGSYPSAAAAYIAAFSAWRAQPVELPRPEPIVVIARDGECSWDAYSRTLRERGVDHG